VAVPDSIKRGRWCPQCSRWTSERTVRSFLEQMCGCKFPSIRPSWLAGRNGRPLELDGYSRRLRIAFEHQGYQHFESQAHFHRRGGAFKRRLELDRVKRQTCRERGVYLIEVPNLGRNLAVENLYDYLAKKLAVAGVRPKVAKEDIRLDPKQIYSPRYIGRLMRTVEEHNGQLLPGGVLSYTGQIRVRCANGHQWDTSTARVLRGHWCPFCAGLARHTLDDARALAEKREGKCLSTSYVNSSTKLQWQCQHGHTWYASFANVQMARWCPVCGPRRSVETKRRNLRPNALRYYYSIADVRAHAKNLGGDCLSDDYISSNSSLVWRCRSGHTWRNSWNNVKRGQWCGICRRAARRDRSRLSSIELEGQIPGEIPGEIGGEIGVEI
jgi:hypothetical protein